jgi:hypothetical protein
MLVTGFLSPVPEIVPVASYSDAFLVLLAFLGAHTSINESADHSRFSGFPLFGFLTENRTVDSSILSLATNLRSRSHAEVVHRSPQGEGGPHELRLASHLSLTITRRMSTLARAP